MFEFQCHSCGKFHQGMPAFGWDYPVQYLDIPEDERETRCDLGTDDCVIDDEWFFVRGCLEIPVIGEEEMLSWGVWVSLSEESFAEWTEAFHMEERSHLGPYFGWLAAAISYYPNTVNLKTLVHLRNNGMRPSIELEPTDHPLAIEQRDGITVERVAEIYASVMHRAEPDA
jgi:hypothetical protein